MKKIILFNKSIVLPDNNKEPMRAYGIVIDSTFYSKLYNIKQYIFYLLFVSELFHMWKSGAIKKLQGDWEPFGCPQIIGEPFYFTVLKDKEIGGEITDEDMFEGQFLTNAELADLIAVSAKKWHRV